MTHQRQRGHPTLTLAADTVRGCPQLLLESALPVHLYPSVTVVEIKGGSAGLTPSLTGPNAERVLARVLERLA